MMFPSQAGGLLLVLFVILLISIETYRSVSKVNLTTMMTTMMMVMVIIETYRSVSMVNHTNSNEWTNTNNKRIAP